MVVMYVTLLGSALETAKKKNGFSTSQYVFIKRCFFKECLNAHS